MKLLSALIICASILSQQNVASACSVSIDQKKEVADLSRRLITELYSTRYKLSEKEVTRVESADFDVSGLGTTMASAYFCSNMQSVSATLSVHWIGDQKQNCLAKVRVEKRTISLDNFQQVTYGFSNHASPYGCERK